MRGGIDPGKSRFWKVALVVDVWKELLSGDGTLSSPGAAGH